MGRAGCWRLLRFEILADCGQELFEDCAFVMESTERISYVPLLVITCIDD